MTTADGRSGSTVGKYRLHEVVGRGGMGVVYRGEHVYIGREVAVKILHEGYGGREESIKRFLREARAASLINHPNIVEVTDFGKANDGTVFFVMELLIGEPLDNILARERRLDLLRSITICNQLTAALAAAHSKGIIHRDLKPENVMLIPREGRRELVRRVADESGAYELSEREKQFDFVKILDFGVAKVREPDAQKGRVTKAGVVFGTPEYMAPETARIGYSDARSDIYALGIMFYEMMTGTVPFTADSPVEVMLKQVNEQVPPMRRLAPQAEITEDAERMILKALAKDPDQRHQSMEEFHRDLQKCYGQLRFRRTLRTPTANQTTAATTPSVVTIPLTRKKKPAVPGAVPSAFGAGGSSSNEIDTGGPRPRAMTPRLPGLPVSAGAPILLTKKKPQRPGAMGADRSNIRMTPPSTARTFPLDDTPLGPQAWTAPAEKTPPPATSLLSPATQTPTKKRTTLPLGMDDPEADRATPAMAIAAVATPASPPRGRDAATGDRGTGDASSVRAAPSAPPHIVALPGRAKDPPVVPPTPARASPPATDIVGGRDADARSWLDEPTSPALPGYPDHPDKAGKAGKIG